MKIAVGSTSQRKLDGVKKVFKQMKKAAKIQVLGCGVKSNVPETPYGRETYEGAKNRAKRCVKNEPQADYYVGMESGLVERYGQIFEEAWSCVKTRDGSEYFGYSSGLKLPDYIKKRMEEMDLEHCDAMTIIEKELGLANDTWSTYTGGIMPRSVSLEESLRNALIQTIASEKNLYNKS